MAEEPDPDLELARALWRHARRLVVAVIGASVVLLGVALLVLPGPGLLVIAAGLALLATEFVWARRALRNARARIEHAIGRERRPDDG